MSRQFSDDQDTTAKTPAAPALLLRIEEAAERLGISRSLMYELVSSGQIKSVHVGRLHRIPTVSLEEYVSDLLMQSAA